MGRGKKVAHELGMPVRTTGCVEVGAGVFSTENKLLCAKARECARRYAGLEHLFFASIY